MVPLGAVAAALLAALPRLAGAVAQGAIKLDNYTLDKMVAVPGLTLLAKFDQAYAYGEKEDAFKELCKLAHTVPDFLIAEIPVQEYGDKENEDLSERFKLTKEEFPAYILFKGDVEQGRRFEGFADPSAQKPSTWDENEDGKWEAPMKKDVTVENLALWLRKFGGVKMPAIGTIAELDDAARKFMMGGFQDADLAQAKALAEGEHKNDKKAQIYVKIMQKIKEKGAAYLEAEGARVAKLMAGKITPQKKADLNDKVRIMAVFSEKE